MSIKEIIAAAQAARDAGTDYDLESKLTAFVAEASSALTAKNAELLGKLNEAKKVAASLPEGFDPDEWSRLTKLEKDGKLNAMEGDAKMEALRKSLTEAHAAELGKFKERESKLTTALEQQLIDNAAGAAISAAKGNSPLLLPHIKQHIKMIQGENGEYQATVIDAAGNERFSLVEAGKPMGISELVGEFKTNDTYKMAFTPDNSGGGGGGGEGGTRSANPFQKGSDAYNLTDQAKMMNENPAQAEALKAAVIPVQ